MITGFSNISAKGSNVLNISSIYGLISPKPELYLKNKKDNSEMYGASKSRNNSNDQIFWCIFIFQ